MTSQYLLVLISGIGAYVASAAIDIELANGSRISPAASFGPPLLAVALTHRAGAAPLVVLLAALVAQALVVALARREASATLAHGLGLMGSYLLIWLYETYPPSRGHKTIGLLVTVVFAAVAYFLADVLVETARTARSLLRRKLLIQNLTTAMPVVVILASGAGLIVLVFPSLKWAAFLILFVPMLATRHEFARYGKARRTYGETVRALAGLAEGAGYVPAGHSTRVAELCVKIGTEMAMSVQRLHQLELVGLLHDVGAVALPDPSDVAAADSEEIARNTGKLLQETEYLAAYADLVSQVASGTTDLPLEGQILKIADAYEGLAGPPAQRLWVLQRSFPEQADVTAALRRVLTVPLS